jgi:hypothetical protein
MIEICVQSWKQQDNKLFEKEKLSKFKQKPKNIPYLRFNRTRFLKNKVH